MRNKRQLNKRKNKLVSIIENHIKQNAREYAISAIIFLLGIILGIILVNISSNENQQNISGYINGFIGSIKNKEYQIDGTKLLVKSIFSNLKIAFIIWIAGSTIIGVPIIYGSVGYKGFCLGYSISAIIATLGRWRGIIFSLTTLLLKNLVAIPCLLALSVSSIKMYRHVIKKEHNRENLKSEIFRHTTFSGIMLVGLSISSIIEIYLTNKILYDIIIYFG